jgi:hypothetical protein
MAHTQIGAISFHVLFYLKRQLFPIRSMFSEIFDWFSLISPVPERESGSENICNVAHIEFFKT